MSVGVSMSRTPLQQAEEQVGRQPDKHQRRLKIFARNGSGIINIKSSVLRIGGNGKWSRALRKFKCQDVATDVDMMMMMMMIRV